MLDQKELLSEFAIPTYEEWRKAAEEALKGAPFEKKLVTKTYEGIDLQPIYNESDRNKVDYLAESMPGHFPFSRGIKAGGYRTNSWEISQITPYPTPKMLNEALCADLKVGQTAITLKVCNCRPMFQETLYVEHPEWDEYICQAVQISDIKDLEDLFNGIDITKYPINFLVSCPTLFHLELASLFVAYCEKNNIDKSKVKVNFGFDIFSFLLPMGCIMSTVSQYMDDLAGLIKLCNEQPGCWTAIAIDGCTYHNGGANALQEISYSVSAGVFYIKEMLTRGFRIEEVAKHIHFNFASGVKFFIEIAKLRAARVVWAKIIKSFGGDEKAQRMVIRAFTSKTDKTKFDPYVNILRGTTEGLAAVLAGANSIHIGTFDEELGMPSDFSRRVARNIQCIIKDEAHTIDTIDPAGGSYYIETLTDKFITESWKIFREVEKADGIVKFVTEGKLQEAIAAIVKERNKNISFRRDTILGTNKYPNLQEKPVETLIPIGKEIPKKHWEETKSRRKATDTKTIWTLKWDERPAKMVETFKNGTIIADVWATKGETEKPVLQVTPVLPFRSAALFEELRNAATTYKTKTGKAPQIYFECFGALKQYKPRVDFSTDFFAVAGFEITNGTGYTTAADAIKNIASINAPIVVICSNDDIYPEVVPEYVKALKTAKSNIKIIVAGMQKDEIVTEFKSAGVDDFIHIKSNVYETLSSLFKAIGVL